MVHPCRATIYQECIFFWGGGAHLYEPIPAKFRTAMRTHVPFGRAKFHMNQCRGRWVNLITVSHGSATLL